MSREVIIVGAGIFGCELALQFESAGYHVTVVEKESEILTGASRLNQNRLHWGYHYPRSRETALQASSAYQDFTTRFSSAIRTGEESFYCVSKNDSLVSFEEYIKFCGDLDLFYQIIPSSTLKKSLNIDLVHKDILSTTEAVFDIDLIKRELNRLLSRSRIKCLYKTKVRKISAGSINHVILEDGKVLEAGIIINCTYSDINNILDREDFQIPLKFQNVILPLLHCGVKIPAMTIMDGRFCSILPKGLTAETYILSNVGTSVLQEKSSIDELDEIESYDRFSSAKAVYESCLDYFPALTKASVVDSWIVRKALLTNRDDRRVSSVFQIPETSIYSVLQGKISTSRLVFEEIKKLEDENNLGRNY